MLKRVSNKKDSLLALLLFLLFVYWGSWQGAQLLPWKQIPAAPVNKALFDFHLGEPQFAGRVLMFWLQTFDMHSGRIVAYDQLDYDRVIGWLEIIRQLDPQSQYPLLTATHVFTETKDKAKIREMLGYVHRCFRQMPQHYWRWQAYAILLAKHRLQDIPLALRYAQDLNRYTQGLELPYWVRDMEFLLLEDMGEFEASTALINAMLKSGIISEARELQFLANKLKAIRERQARL